MILPDRLFQEPIENKPRKIHDSKAFRQLARDNIKLDDKELNKELAKKINNPYYFTDRALRVGFKINFRLSKHQSYQF